jgi:hypothetical protein
MNYCKNNSVLLSYLYVHGGQAIKNNHSIVNFGVLILYFKDNFKKNLKNLFLLKRIFFSDGLAKSPKFKNQNL